MGALMRMWGAVAALGAALIAIAVGAAATPWLAVLLLAAGAGQAAVAIASLRGWRWPLGLLLAPLGLPTAAWLLALLAVPESAASLPFAPMLAETGLALAAAFALLADRRRGVAPEREREPRPAIALGSLAAVAAVVAAVATPALAGTNAGAYAQPHGEHGLTIEEHSGH